MTPENKWGNGGPPEEAYGRVTNRERFRPLHHDMLEMLNALETRFEVERVEGYGLDEELESRGLVHPSIVLRPADSKAAPVAVAFTDFPGLRIRFGRWYTDSFPSCGCDACDESAESEIEKATKLVRSLTAGEFREAVIHSPISLPSAIGSILRKAFTLPRKESLRGSQRRAELRRPSLRFSSMGIGDIVKEDFAPLGSESLRGSRQEAEFRGHSFGRSSKSRLNDARALQMTDGRRHLELNWKPWPSRQAKAGE